MAGSAQDKAFEVFVKRAVGSIQKESWGRSRDAKELRDACAAFLTTLEQHESGTSVEANLAVTVLQPLSLACTNSNPKVVELALGCLHKLVAHAWLYGESSLFEGLMDDGSDVVSQVIKIVVKCGECTGEALQLAVIRALLTFTTAEHFVAHGDCLMAAVRTVFNLALGSDAEIIKRTAGNALLQMLNTVVKRITSNLHHYGDNMSTASSMRNSDGGGDELSHGHIISRRTSSTGPHAAYALAAAAAAATAAMPLPSPPPELPAGSPCTSSTSGLPAMADSGVPGELASDARTAQFASLAELRDLRGLEAAIGASADNLEEQDEAQPTATATVASGSARSPDMPQPRQLADGSHMSVTKSGNSSESLAHGSASAVPSPSKAALLSYGSIAPSGRRNQSLASLTVMERDVLHVLTAFCKLASRESGLTEVESFLHQGKLLALELLAKVLQNPHHTWGNVRDEFCRHLRQPLCITLLRNCSSASDPAAFQLAIKLLVTVILKPKLRLILKAELGAFYPLYILRPLETGRQDLHTLQTVLGSLKLICMEPQLVVDLFVNYDCDLQAPCLYERTVAQLTSLARMTEAELERPQQVGKQQEQAARIAAIKDTSLKSLLSVIACLDAWAAPIREAHVRAAEGAPQPLVAAADEDGPGAANMGRTPSPPSSHRDGELERFEAMHNHKASLAKGIALFNTSPVKGVRYLLHQGLVQSSRGSTAAPSPADVAAFLREHQADLQKTALGEYFGHHDDFAVAVMHAWIDMQPSWSGIPIDGALRLLLEQFRLPGEAQKIDRIMEKFAERYVHQHPGKFATADGAYMLAFAIIMLNTDAHNPLAERRLAKADFVAMNSGPGVPASPQREQQQGSPEPAAAVPASYVPVLPLEELEGIYDRIVMAEIKLRDDVSSAYTRAPEAHSRLAAALGLRTLASHFRPMSRGWGRQQQGLSEADRKRKLVELAERAVMSAGVSGLWYTSTHSEHTRPMLTVSGGPILEALTYSLAAAHSPTTAAPLIAAIVSIVELSSLLGLEELCEACVGALAKSAGLSSGPAPYGSPEEGKQLAALKALLGLASGPVAGLLGSGWTIMLETAAALDALAAELAAGSQPVPALLLASPADQPAGLANPFNKMFQALGISLGGAAPNGGRQGSSGGQALLPVPSRPQQQQQGAAGGTGEAPDHPDRPVRFTQVSSPSAIRPANGAGLVLWALSDGYEVVEKVYSSSTGLDGEAVIVFFRALCAVSREELDAVPHRGLQEPSSPQQGRGAAASHGPYRLYSLQRLLDCAHANTDRIRLIRSKLWAVTGAHLVMVACHPASSVAVYAVNALHGLAQRLLARAELARFTQQEEALKPFVSVLRVCDEPEVRRLTVRSAIGSCAPHCASLGSGWRTLLEVLRRAAADSTTAVVVEATGALKAAVQALYRTSNTLHASPTDTTSMTSSNGHGARAAAAGGGVSSAEAAGPRVSGTSDAWQLDGSHEYFQETLAAVMAAALNQVQPAYVGLAATQLLAACGARLAAHQQQLQLPSNCDQLPSGPLLHADSRGTWCCMGYRSLASAHAACSARAAAASAIRSALAWRRRRMGRLCVPGWRGLSWAVRQLAVMPAAFRGELLAQLAATCLSWFGQEDEGVACLGLKCFDDLARRLAKQQDAAGWQLLLEYVSVVLKRELQGLIEQLQGHAPAAGRAPGSRAHLVLLLQRLLVALHRECMACMPWQVQARLAMLLVGSAKTSQAFNMQRERQHAAAVAAAVVLPGAAAGQKQGASVEEARGVQGLSAVQEAGSGLEQVGSKLAEEAGDVEPTIGPSARETEQVEYEPDRSPQEASANGNSMDHVTGPGPEDEVIRRDASALADEILEASVPGSAAAAADAVVGDPAGAAATARRASNEVGAASKDAAAKLLASAVAFTDALPPSGAAGVQQAATLPAAVILSSAESRDEPVYSLGRLECEAVAGSLAVLELCCASAKANGDSSTGSTAATPSASSDQEMEAAVAAAVEAGPQQVLGSFCLHLIAAAAEAAQADAGASAGAAEAAVPLKPWHCYLRAANLAQAIAVYLALPCGQGANCVAALWPFMVALIGSPHAMVRHAVADFFYTRVGPVALTTVKVAEKKGQASELL